MKKYILTLFISIVSISFITNAKAQDCPPTITTSSDASSSTEDSLGTTWTICPGENVLIVSSNASGYQWYHDGVMMDTAVNQAIEAKQVGEYYVMTEGCSTPSETITIAHFELPSANITLSNSPVCSGVPITVTVSVSEDVEFWGWILPTTNDNDTPNPYTSSYTADQTFKIHASNENCGILESETLTVIQPLDPGAIGESQTICPGVTPNELTGTTPTGEDGTYEYQWQHSADSGETWNAITGANALNYQPPALTQTTWYRRVVTTPHPVCPVVTQFEPLEITVNEFPTITSETALEICSTDQLNYTITSDVDGTTFEWTGVNTSGNVTGVSSGSGDIINDQLSIPVGATSGTATYTITPTGPAPTYCEGDPVDLVVTVLPLPIPTISGDASVCNASTGNLYFTEAGMINDSYVWTTSEGGTITSGQGTHEIDVEWTSAGAQWVRVTYEGLNGCTPLVPTQYDVTVKELPIPQIDGPSTPCLGASGNVYTTESDMDNYVWDYSSGGSITGGDNSDNITITWNTPGEQWVSMVYTDPNGCRNTIPTVYTVNVSQPSIDGPITPCLGSSANVYTTEAGMTDYTWSYPGGTLISGGDGESNSITLQWNSTGSKTVSVNYTTAAGCRATSPATISPEVQPLPTPTTSGNNEVCEGATGVVYTTESGVGIGSYVWSVSSGGAITSGGTGVSNTATVTWNTAGDQEVFVNYTDANGCTAESPTSYPVTVNTLPEPTITGSISVCSGMSGVEYITEAAQENYVWDVTGGTITSGGTTNDNTAIVTWSIPGPQTLSVNYTGSNGCDAATPTELTVDVLPLPEPNIDGLSSVCVNATNVEYTTETGMTDYHWTVSSGGVIVGSSTNNNLFVNWNTIGSHTVQVTYTGTNGCDAATPGTYNVTVNDLPSPTITDGSSEVCNNSTESYTTQPGMSDYEWLVTGGEITSGGTSSDNTATVTWNTTGTQNVSINYSQTGCSATSPYLYEVTVNPLPTSDAGPPQSIPYGTSTILEGVSGAGTPGYTQAWTPMASINGDNTSPEVETENLYTDTDFTFTVTDSKGCIATDIVQINLVGAELEVTAAASPQVICNMGTTVQLNASASGGNSANQAEYMWTSTPAGFTSNHHNPEVNPTQTTTYNVSVNDGYNVATNTVLVTVNPLPTVYSVTGGGEYCNGGTGLSVGLSGSQSGVNYQLLLNGEDLGTPVPGTGNALSFDNLEDDGTYNILASNATTSCVTNMSGSVDISINPLPTADAGQDQNILHGMSTNLTGVANQGTSPYSYLWAPSNMINSGIATSAPTTNNLYATQNFVLTVTDSKGCIATDNMDVIINGDPLSVTASADISTICAGSEVQLSASGSGGSADYTYAWSSDPGTWTSNEQNPSVNPSTTTVYTVTIDDGYNTSDFNITINVNPNPSAYTVSGGGEYCSGETGLEINLSDSDIGVNYQLYADDIYTGDEIAGTGGPITFVEQGNESEYTIIAKRVSTSCESLMTGTADINILPLPNEYDLSGGGSYPEGGVGVPVGLDGSQIGVDYQLWLDSINTGITVAGTGSAIEFGNQTDAGEYTVRGINEITGCYLNMTNSVIVSINPYPEIFNVFGGGTICASSDIEVGLDGSEIGIEYTLIRDGISISNNIPGTGDSLNFGNFGVSGTYIVRAKNISSGLTADMAENAVIIVKPLPELFNLTYLQPDDGCVPIIPHLNGSEMDAIYELNYEDHNGYYSPAIETITGTGSDLNFSSQTNAGIYTVTATIDYNDVSCNREMLGSIVADSVPKEFETTPQGELCENDDEICIVGSEEGVDYQLWLNNQPFGPIIPGRADGGSICFGNLTDPGTYRIHAQNTTTLCEIFFTEEITINPQPIKYVMSPAYDCAGAEIVLNECEVGIEYYLYFEPATNMREFIEVMGPVTCSGGGSINFGSQSEEGTYRIKAVNPLTNCSVWMDGATTIYPNPEVFEISPQAGGCAPLEIYLENFEADATYYLYLDGENIASIDGSIGSVNFGEQSLAGTYTVRAKFTHPGSYYCWSDMMGEVTIYDAAQVYSLTPEGPSCPPVTFQLSGSEAGTDYTLWRDNFGEVQTITGNGSILYFDELTETGQYWVIALTGDACETQMNGIGVINEIPSLYSITPIGQFCSDDNVEIGLSDSDIGVTYQLMRDNSGTIPQAEVSGDGNAIIFGNFTADGTYTVLAVDDVSDCERQMDGELVLYDPPHTYSIVPDSGLYCPPQTIGLENSVTGIDYTLHTPEGNNETISGTGSPIEFGTFTYPGDYSVTAFNSATECSSDMNGVVTIHNGPDVFDLTCLTEPLYCSGDNSAIELVLSYSQTGTSYQLYKDDDSNPVFPAQTGTGNLLTWTEVSQYGPGDYYVKATFIADPTCSATMNGIIEVEEIPLPTANAGTGDIICESETYQLDGTATNYTSASVLWTVTNGTGSFDDPTKLDAIFTPGNINESSQMTITLTVGGDGPCNNETATSDVIIEVDPLPEAYAGSDGIICENQGFHLSDATVDNISSFEWKIFDGQGYFDDATMLTPVFYPDLVDESTEMILMLIAHGENQCNNSRDTSFVTVQINPEPFADAGVEDTLLCQNQGYEILTSNAENYTSLQWTIINGSGSFDNSSLLHPIYFPSEADAQEGFVTLTLTANQTACGSATDYMVLQVSPAPEVYAGPDATIYFESTLPLVDATLSNAISQSWSTSGTGSFTPDNTTLNATYDPSPLDEAIGAVVLTLSAEGEAPCDDVSDSFQVTLVDPNLDFTFTDPCVSLPVHFDIDESITDVDALANFYWEFGDGENSTQYEPSHIYETSGSYQVHLTVTDTLGYTASTSKMLIVNELPEPFFDTDAPACDGSAVQFTDYTNTPSGYATSWHWDFGDGQDTLVDFPASPHVKHIYAQAATYAVTLTVETNLGCVNDYTRAVTVHASPITLFEWDASCQGQPTVFTDLSVENGGGDLTAWHWDFDDPESGIANTSEAQHPQHTFSTPGTYEVMLITENITGCTDTLTQSVSVSAAPAVAFTSENTCYGQLSTFSADEAVMDTAAIATWLWDFGDGYSSNDQVMVEHLYNVADSYTVMLTVTDTAGCTSSVSESIEILALPMAQFDYDQPACFENAVMFDDYSTTEEGYITEWYYNFGDGNDTTVTHPENPNVHHSYQTPGNYEATLTVLTSTGCIDSITHTVDVEPVPEVNFDYSIACQNTAVQFEDLTQEAGSGDILFWSWNFGDPLSGANNTSSDPNPQHVYSEPGAYAVTLFVETANGCSDSLTQPLTVYASPEVGFTYNQGCLSDTTEFISSDFVDEGSISNYSWSFGDGGTSSAMNPLHIYTQEGEYMVSLSVTDTTGCSATYSEIVTIAPLPTASFTYTINGCSNEPVYFDDNSFSDGSGIVEWYWEFGDGSDTLITAPNIADISHLYTSPSTYEVSLTITNESGCSHTMTHNVQVLAAPDAQFTFEGHCQNEVISFTDVSQADGGTQINSWNWYFDDPVSGGDNTSTLQNPLHLFSEADTFNVQLVVSNLSGCTDTIINDVGVATPPGVAIESPLETCQDIATLFMPDTNVVDTLAIDIYEWTFGDGSDPVYQRETEHIFAQPGEYVITLTVTDTVGCSNEAITTINVEESPTAAFSYQDACLGGTTLFNDESFTDGGDAITEWYWDFGDPYVDSAQNHPSIQNPGHTYSVDSTYQVKLVIWTESGCKDSITSDVLVRPVPHSWFTYDTTACTGGEVFFYDSSWSDNSAITAWQWTFEQGYTSDLKNPGYVFDDIGEVYPVELVAYDAFGCSDTTVRDIVVPEGFAVDYSVSTTCLGDTTYFNDSLVAPAGDSIIAVSWNFGDPASGGANVSDQHDPEHYYGQAGTYTITLEATDENYCTTTVSKALQVHALPEPAFTWQSYPCDSAVYVNDMSTTAGVITRWVWHWGDGDSDTVVQGETPDISHMYTNAGSYEVTLEVTNSNGCVNMFTQNVYREPCVAAMIEMQADTLCQGMTLTFADSSQIQEVIESWEWDFGDGTAPITYTSYQEEITHSYADTGTYEVTLTVEAMYDGQLRVNTDSVTINIRPTPTAQFGWNDICQVQEMEFEDRTGTDSADIVSWQWDFGEAIEEDTSTQQHPGWLYSEAGYYDVRLSVMNEYGCEDSTMQEVTVHRAPAAQIAHDTSCFMDPTLFYDGTDTTGLAGEIVSWRWDFGIDGIRGDTSNLPSPEYVYISEGSRMVTLAVEDEFGCRDTAQRIITTHPVPGAAFEVEQDYEQMQGRFALTNSSQEAVEYDWDFGMVAYHYDQEYHENNENPVIVYEDDGWVEITLIAWNQFNCPDTAVYADSLLFKGLFVPNAFSPNNPHAGVRNFKPVGINLESYHMQVYDVRGNLLWETRELDDEGSPTESWDGTFEGEPLPQAVYIWKAEGMFKDGTVWDGDEVGTSELSSQKRYGTVTLIR